MGSIAENSVTRMKPRAWPIRQTHKRHIHVTGQRGPPNGGKYRHTEKNNLYQQMTIQTFNINKHTSIKITNGKHTETELNK